MKRLYLDANASTPLHPRVREAFVEALELFGHPGSLHEFGRRSRRALDEARQRVADRFGVEVDEVYFTGGGTESNSIALLGLTPEDRPMFTSSVEHPAVREPALRRWRRLAEFQDRPLSDGWVEATSHGLSETLPADLQEDDLLSIQWVNSETGVIHDVRKIASLARERGARIHSDGAQGFFRCSETVGDLGVDAATIASHKSFGPRGVAALVVRRGVILDPQCVGGPQERGVRPGTENVAAIHAFGVLCELSRDEDLWPEEELRSVNAIFRESLSEIPGLEFTAAIEDCFPNVCHATLDDLESDRVLALLDRRGIAASSGSACSAGTGVPSTVLQALGLPDARVRGALRFSFTKNETADDLRHAASELKAVVESLRDGRG